MPRLRLLEARLTMSLWKEDLIMVVLIGLYLAVGHFDYDSAQVTDAIAKDADARVAAEREAYDPTRAPRVTDCERIGKQWVAWRDDGGPWIHACVRAAR